jgi:hypothetical protein
MEKKNEAAPSDLVTLNGDDSNGVSVCIPRVFDNIGWRRIKSVFVTLNWGYVERVDVVQTRHGRRAFVHFSPGRFTNKRILEQLRAGKQVQILYDDPWFWKVSLSRSRKPEDAPPPPRRPEVRIL